MFPKNVLKFLWNPEIGFGGVATTGIPDYPSTLKKSSEDVIVPLPALYTVAWTEPASTVDTFCDFPPTNSVLITVPDPQENPALYNAAIDTIRLSNDFFVKSGCTRVGHLPNGYPKDEYIEKLAEEFLETYADEGYVLPPDPRTLWVTDKNYHPADKCVPWNNRLWILACEKFGKMDEDTKWKLITTTNAAQQKEYAESFKAVQLYNDFLVRMFTTYLAHDEYAAIKKAKADEQPHAAELDAFFSLPENEKGVTVYDLHRQYINVKDVKEFIRRIERFATYTTRPAKFGKDAEEAIFVRKPIPSSGKIQEILTDAPCTLPELLAKFPEGVGSQQAVLHMLCEIAAPDFTTGRWILVSNKGPSAMEIWGAMNNRPSLARDMISKFPDQVWSLDRFLLRLSKVAYQESEQEAWVPLIGNPVTNFLLGVEESRKIRAMKAMMEQDPLRVLGWLENSAEWDGEKFGDKPKEEEVVEDLEGDTEGDTEGEEDDEVEVVEVIDLTTPPSSPKRKRAVEDDGEEELGVQDAPKRIIKKMRTRVDRCSYPAQG